MDRSGDWEARRIPEMIGSSPLWGKKAVGGPETYF
jgi:hypothetical protein